MGLVAKSLFWLGLVYVAMPFDSGMPAPLRPTGTAISPKVSPASGSSAGARIAAALCSSSCFRAPPKGLADAPAPKGSAEPLRHVPREKSGRAEAVRPLIANHIRSPEGQT
jgi:hypothetical protein